MTRTGPVIMGHPTARAQLETDGVVLSFRTSDRTTGETHYRYERTGTSQGAVRITKETDRMHPNSISLVPYYPLSGFASTEDWVDAIKEMHGALNYGYIYRIELLEDNNV